ncbi:hypothetical protein NLJ89_g6379 [Agrocybe chaxingu]|uniref:Ribosomal lysine N-methyltransferase 4 n=1 Tax=Agrocybe chaxingu TaxID=84603 RepID=A0A9W8JWL2_9AGAR|nr:hypothetical protein NLJ89_g6379 [Agrocybe chaxingu]
MPSPEILPFFAWFQSHDGFIDTDAMDVIQFPPSEGGRGAVALKDIPEGHTVFAIPRSLVLSTRTSTLPQRFGENAWKKAKLHQGWSGLILCMMWEAAGGSHSKWSAYFESLPTSFDTPMFWNDEDLAELKGTSVVDKLGKDQAEKDFAEKVLPAVLSRPDLFNSQDIPTKYTLETYHLMGTRISSRSFTLEKEEEEKEHHGADHSAENEGANTSMGSAMDIDAPPSHEHQGDEEHADEGHEEEHEEVEEEEDSPEVVMIPLADILNARYKTENVKLFYEPDCLKMVSTKPIKAGEQIWNTYGDLPNAELLRGFGHIDYLPLPGTNKFGNPGDVVEVRADLFVQCALEVHPDLTKDAEGELMERIDWWLEEGGDDVFVLEVDPDTSQLEIPPPVLSFTRLILLQAEWERAKSKGKPPKPTQDAKTLAVFLAVLEKRLQAYDTTLKADETVLATQLNTFSLNKRHALIVRVGEKRIVHAYLDKTRFLLDDARTKEAAASGSKSNGKGKRQREADDSEKDGAGRRSKRHVR